ncbi:WXG100 family type VII secretion target [Kitasatospora indigofera]|uniref:WXG100 family type VII secretion target n=1 Tax=Kitasatospora indigofera TaxID=67307 RepID=UPI003662D39B
MPIDTSGGGSGFEVKPEVLESAGQNGRRTAARLPDQANGLAAPAEAARGALKGWGSGAALNSCTDSWKAALDSTAADMDRCGDNLVRTAANYRAADQANAGTMAAAGDTTGLTATMTTMAATGLDGAHTLPYPAPPRSGSGPDAVILPYPDRPGEEGIVHPVAPGGRDPIAPGRPGIVPPVFTGPGPAVVHPVAPGPARPATVTPIDWITAPHPADIMPVFVPGPVKPLPAATGPDEPFEIHHFDPPTKEAQERMHRAILGEGPAPTGL